MDPTEVGTGFAEIKTSNIPLTGWQKVRLASSAIVLGILATYGASKIPMSEEQKMYNLIHRDDLPLTGPGMDQYYADVGPSTAAIFAGTEFYKEERSVMFEQGHFTPNYGSVLKILASKNISSKDNNPALDLEGGREEAAKLVFGYTPQNRPNLAYKFLLRHSLLFSLNRPPLDQVIDDPHITPEMLVQWKNPHLIPYEKKYLNELTELNLEAMLKVAAVDGNDKQNLFARRIETGFLEEESEKGMKMVNNYFGNLDLADKIPAGRFVEFFMMTGLDQSSRLRALVIEKSGFSPLYAEMLKKLPPITTPVVPLPRSEIVNPNVPTPAERDIARIEFLLEQINKSLDDQGVPRVESPPASPAEQTPLVLP